jgi:hypothetical protein
MSVCPSGQTMLHSEQSARDKDGKLARMLRTDSFNDVSFLIAVMHHQ